MNVDDDPTIDIDLDRYKLPYWRALADAAIALTDADKNDVRSVRIAEWWAEVVVCLRDNRGRRYLNPDRTVATRTVRVNVLGKVAA